MYQFASCIFNKLDH